MRRWAWGLLALAGCDNEGSWVPGPGTVPFTEPRESVPELTEDQDRLVVLVLDVSSSFHSLSAEHFSGVDQYVSRMVTDQRRADSVGVVLFAEEIATGDGVASTNPSALPWIGLTAVHEDLSDFWLRMGTVCPQCDPSSAEERPAFPTMRGCTNPAVGIAQAARVLADSGDDNDFRGMVVVTGHGFNCGGGLSGALAAADAAYNDNGVHVWTIQPEVSGVPMDEVPYLTRGAGFFQFTQDRDEVAGLYAKAAAGLPQDAR